MDTTLTTRIIVTTKTTAKIITEGIVMKIKMIIRTITETITKEMAITSIILMTRLVTKIIIIAIQKMTIRAGVIIIVIQTDKPLEMQGTLFRMGMTVKMQCQISILTSKFLKFLYIDFLRTNVDEWNKNMVTVENVLGETVEITDTPLKGFFSNKYLLGTKNPDARDFFTDELIKNLMC